MKLKIASRLQKLRDSLERREIDAIFISQPENRYYISEFNGSAGFLLITKKDAILATDFRYIEQAKVQAPGYKIFRITNGIASWFPELTGGLNLNRLGFEARHITSSQYQQLSETLKKQNLPLKLTPVDDLVESLRMIKEPEEIECITRAAGISDNAIEYIEDTIHAGMTEINVAWELEKILRENGSQSLPFDIIVASGPNAALPHAKPSQRTISPGEPVIIDIGARIGNYCSDLSRTICLGDPDANFKKIYDVVHCAQLTAVAIIKEGMSGEQADSLARTVIEQAGYEENFGHALGHGIGLASHESPCLGPGSTETLTSDMVFSIEPGIYLPGWGGVRIEDLVILEKGKVTAISKARKGLL